MGDLSKDINSKFPNEKVKALINIKYTANWLENIGNEILKNLLTTFCLTPCVDTYSISRSDLSRTSILISYFHIY